MRKGLVFPVSFLACFVWGLALFTKSVIIDGIGPSLDFIIRLALVSLLFGVIVCVLFVFGDRNEERLSPHDDR